MMPFVLLVLLVVSPTLARAHRQMAFSQTPQWSVQVDSTWDVLGPFPIHAREQHFLSPSCPLNLSELPFRVDTDERWYSSYADGGKVGWSSAQSDREGNLEVSFPDIRWSNLRRSEGWAALQHHAVLHTTVTIIPPLSDSDRGNGESTPRLRISLEQGSFFALLPRPSGSEEARATFVPEWHAGNIYAIGRSPASSVDFPAPPSLTEPTTYDLIVSGDYEIRLFGDPLHFNTETPKLQIHLSVTPEDVAERVELQPSHDVVCDFVGGYAFGDAFGVGVRAVDGWWTVDRVEVGSESEALALELTNEIRLAPTQTRIVPIRISQSAPFFGDHIHIHLHLSLSSESGSLSKTVSVRIPVTQIGSLAERKNKAIKSTYFYTPADPRPFLAIPPSNVGDEKPRMSLPVLALHGAGVDIIGHPFFAESLPHFSRSWTIIPTGGTEWGLDWHGPSAADAWSCVGALGWLLSSPNHVDEQLWKTLAFEEDTKIVLLGHSNGGQGAWYISARYPDRVAAVVPAAGYIKAQQYVPLVQSRSAHFVDPALRAILESSLTPDDDDLFLSNLVDTPLFAVHGGDDDNVPTWHSREAVGVVKTWRSNANASYKEDEGQPHWYPTVLDSPPLRAFLDEIFDGGDASVIALQNDAQLKDAEFTLTVADPASSGSLHGFSIEVLRLPGRLSRLHVVRHEDVLGVKTMNVHVFSFSGTIPFGGRLVVDGQEVDLTEELEVARPSVSRRTVRRDTKSKRWHLEPLSNGEFYGGEYANGAPTRIQSILTSSKPLTIIIPSKRTSPAYDISGALRLAHALDVYFKLSVTIIDDTAARELIDEGLEGNVIVLGAPGESTFLSWVFEQGGENPAFSMKNGVLHSLGTAIDQPSQAAIFLHPPPKPNIDKMLVLYAHDAPGFERVLRLFPIRTGVTVPSWVVIGEEADRVGAAGVQGAGVWGHDWSLNEAMVWTP